MDVLVDFSGIPWESPQPGVRLKVVAHGDQRLRLVEFSEGFTEPDWCTQGHAGRVLEGAFTLELRDRSVRLEEGDALFSPPATSTLTGPSSARASAFSCCWPRP